MAALKTVVRRLWWHGVTPATIAAALELDRADVEALLFTRVAG